MSARSTFFALWVAACLAGCGAAPSLRVYQGTLNETGVDGMVTTTIASTGVRVTVLHSSADARQWAILWNPTWSLDATLDGSTLSFSGMQTTTTTTNDSAQTVTLNSASGTMTADALTLKLTISTSQANGGPTKTTSATYVFDGKRQ